jgi:hypothetical protein
VLRLRQEPDGLLSGEFETALEDSIFFGSSVPIAGLCCGSAMSFSLGLERNGVAAVCTFTGRLEGERLETMWHVVSTDRPWPHAVATNADTFEKLE